MSILQTLRDARPRRFRLQLTRARSCCHICEFALPSHTVRAFPSGLYSDPLRDLLRVVIALNPEPARHDWLEVSDWTSFSWDCEPDMFNWKFRHLKKVAGIRLIITHGIHVNAPGANVIVDTILEERELFHQIWENACTLLREGGMAYEASHAPFPVREFWKVHEIVTGEKAPNSLADEIHLMTRIAGMHRNEQRRDPEEA